MTAKGVRSSAMREGSEASARAEPETARMGSRVSFTRTPSKSTNARVAYANASRTAIATDAIREALDARENIPARHDARASGPSQAATRWHARRRRLRPARRARTVRWNAVPFSDRARWGR